MAKGADMNLGARTGAPLVSVIMPAYNHEAFVEEAITSIAAQTYPNIELIIIDDGSTDRTCERIEHAIAALDREMKLQFHTQSNAGVCKTLNRGLALASGEFVEFIASDDAYLGEKTRRSVDALLAAGRQVAAVYCDGFVIDAKSRRIGLFSDRYPVPYSNAYYQELIVANWIPAPGLLYRRGVIEELGGFDASLNYEDWDLLLRLTARYGIVRIPERLFLYREHGSNLHKDEAAMAATTVAIAEKYPEFDSFIHLKDALRRRAFGRALALLNWTNLDLLARHLMRGRQLARLEKMNSMRMLTSHRRDA